MLIFHRVRKGMYTDFLLGTKTSSMRYEMINMLIFYEEVYGQRGDELVRVRNDFNSFIVNFIILRFVLFLEYYQQTSHYI